MLVINKKIKKRFIFNNVIKNQTIVAIFSKAASASSQALKQK